MKEDFERLEADFADMKLKLEQKEADNKKLLADNLIMKDKVKEFDAKKDEWRRNNEQLESYFRQQLETIRSNFDLQLRDLLDKHRMEIDMLESMMRDKQLKMDGLSSEIVLLKTKQDTQGKFSKLKEDLTLLSNQNQSIDI